MKITTKLQLSKITTLIIIFTTLAILVWLVGFIISVTFKLSVFDADALVFLFAVLAGAFILILCSAILNIVINMSLIAEKNIKKLENNGSEISYKKIALFFGLAVLTIGCFLFLGDFISKNDAKNILIQEAQDIVSRYPNSINVLKKGLSDKNYLKEIPDTLKFLSSVKKEFPYVLLITSDKFNNDTVYLYITQWSSKNDLSLPLYGHAFYECNKKDCEYLSKVFFKNSLQQYFYQADQDFNLYIPFSENGKRFVLLFSKNQRYGKIGLGKYS